MGVNSLPKTVTRQRRGCDLKPGPSAPESSTLTTRLPSHPKVYSIVFIRFDENQLRALKSWCRESGRPRRRTVEWSDLVRASQVV